MRKIMLYILLCLTIVVTSACNHESENKIESEIVETTSESTISTAITTSTSTSSALTTTVPSTTEALDENVIKYKNAYFTIDPSWQGSYSDRNYATIYIDGKAKIALSSNYPVTDFKPKSNHDYVIHFSCFGYYGNGDYSGEIYINSNNKEFIKNRSSYYFYCSGQIICIRFENMQTGYDSEIKTFLDNISFDEGDPNQITEDLPISYTDSIEATTITYDTEPPTEMATKQQLFEPFTISGTGDMVATDVKIPSALCIYTATHDGESNFIAHFYDCGDSRESLVNEIGSYSGTQVLDATGIDDSSSGMVEIKADGNWSITFSPIQSVIDSSISNSFSGYGDSVTGIFQSSGNTICTLSHDGDSNFIVKAYEYADLGDRESAANEIGAYSGQSVLRLEKDKLYFFNVVADGNWTISIE